MRRESAPRQLLCRRDGPVGSRRLLRTASRGVYAVLLRPDPWIAAAAIVLLAVLHFVPVPLPASVPRAPLRMFSALLIVAWAALCGGRAPPRYVAGALGDRRAVRRRPLFPRRRPAAH